MVRQRPQSVRRLTASSPAPTATADDATLSALPAVGDGKVDGVAYVVAAVPRPGEGWVVLEPGGGEGGLEVVKGLVLNRGAALGHFWDPRLPTRRQRCRRTATATTSEATRPITTAATTAAANAR